MPSKRGKKNKGKQVVATAPREVVLPEAQRIVQAAAQLPDVFADFKAFQSYKRPAKEIDVTFEYFSSYAAMPGEAQSFVFDLLKRNMQEHYNHCGGMGWNDKKKKKELKHAEARFVIAWEADEKEETKRCPVAFCHLRFEVEEGFAVLYVYEIQLEQRVTRKGLGKFLMQVMELVAWKHDFAKVMLTVFKTNGPALGLYQAMKYTPDETDPNDYSTFLDDDPDVNYNENVGYVILKKDNPKKNKKKIINKKKTTTTTPQQQPTAVAAESK